MQEGGRVGLAQAHSTELYESLGGKGELSSAWYTNDLQKKSEDYHIIQRNFM